MGDALMMCFTLPHLKKAVETKYPGASQCFDQLCDFLRDQHSDGKVSRFWQPRTEGNPSSDVAQCILLSIGADPQLGLAAPDWALVKAVIDRRLLKVRNAVAHGEGLPVDQQDVLDASDSVLSLMERTKNTIVHAGQTLRW